MVKKVMDDENMSIEEKDAELKNINKKVQKQLVTDYSSTVEK